RDGRVLRAGGRVRTVARRSPVPLLLVWPGINGRPGAAVGRPGRPGRPVAVRPVLLASSRRPAVVGWPRVVVRRARPAHVLLVLRPDSAHKRKSLLTFGGGVGCPDLCHHALRVAPPAELLRDDYSWYLTKYVTHPRHAGRFTGPFPVSAGNARHAK